jgi:sugar diacid utilization regulator
MLILPWRRSASTQPLPAAEADDEDLAAVMMAGNEWTSRDFEPVPSASVGPMAHDVDALNAVVGDLRFSAAFGPVLDKAQVVLALQSFRESLLAHLAVHGEVPPPADAAFAPLERLGTELAMAGLEPVEVDAFVDAAMKRAVLHLTTQLTPPSEQTLAGIGAVNYDTVGLVLHAARAIERGYAHHQQLTLVRQVRARRGLLGDLLAGLFRDEAELVAKAAAIGHDLAIPHGVVMAVIPEPDESGSRHRIIQDALLDGLPGAIDVVVRLTPIAHAVGVVPAPSDDAWQQVLARVETVIADERLIVLTTEPVAGPTAIRHSYEWLVPRLDLAARVSTPGLLRPRDLIVYRALAGDRGIVDEVLGSVLARPPSKRRRLLATLEALRTSNRLADVARILGLTPKGLAYRLSLIRTLTGLDPADTQQRFALDVVYRAWQLFGLDDSDALLALPAESAWRGWGSRRP